MRFVSNLFWSLLAVLAIFSSCTLNNVNKDDAAAVYFKQNNLDGTFALLDNVHELFTVYNLNKYKDSSYAPGGSFGLLTTLLSIETGRYLDEKSMIPTPHDTLSLGEAFHLGDETVMEREIARIGIDTLQTWMDSLHYGKGSPVTANTAFWKNDSLKITPDEQLGFFSKLYFEKLPFQKRTQQIVHRLMVRENNTLYTLAYKSSWDQLPSGKYLGWIVGWIEENKHVYFFVINATPVEGTPTQGVLLKTVKAILKHYGFFEGKK